jgi:hypothetical protein
MSNITKTEPFSLTPKSLDEAMKYAELLAKSSIVPKGYQGKAGDVLVAIQMGQELGLKPMQALQNIAVINGKPSIYGDSLLALVKNHPTCEDVIETFDPVKMEATCIAKRKGKSDVVQTFNKEKATKAQLWGKMGPWTQYPERMLQLRARGFALRDQFPDVLQGLILAEEAQDMPIENVTPQQSKASQLADLISSPTITEPANDSSVNDNVSVEAPEDFFDMVEELTQLVIKHAVPSETVNKWLEKADANSFEEMPDGAVRACIAYVKEKYA